MPTILKREFAPISDQAWNELDSEAARLLRENLTGRRLVNFSGPHGWEFAALNIGRLEVANKKTDDGVGWGVRKMQPIVEVRVPFVLPQMEIDNVARGAGDVDLDPLQEAIEKAARFEDKAIYHGFGDADMQGIIANYGQEVVTLPADGGDFPKAIGQALKALSAAGIGGPYALVLGTDEYYDLMQAGSGGYPPHRIIEDMLEGGDILKSPVVSGGVVLSTRGDDYELAVGKDFSLGYANHGRDSVELFVTESFTFRINEPRAAVPLSKAGK
ncbi:MAG: family 1 encapsulin nanocompartment shell protein [Phycisphaerae bacterium]